MSPTARAYIRFHLALLLWGFTAILGDIITLSALVLVWWRVGISGIGLGLIPNTLANVRRINPKTRLVFILAGILVALHWLCFYGSIKLANASIGVLTLSTASLFTVFAEALVYKKAINRMDILFGISVIPVMWLVASDLSGSMTWGLIVGLLSSLLLASFTMVNKVFIHQSDPVSISFIEMLVSWLFLGLVLVIILTTMDWSLNVIPGRQDWLWLMVLSIFCTILPFVLSLYALRILSAFTTNFLFNLEPVYGIVLAAVLLKDHRELSFSFYLGAILLLVLVVAYSILKEQNKRPLKTAEHFT